MSFQDRLFGIDLGAPEGSYGATVIEPHGIEVLRLLPGDILVASVKDEISLVAADQLQQMLRKVIPDGIEILIADGVTFSVIRKDENGWETTKTDTP